MAAGNITTTPGDITGDFRLSAIKTTEPGGAAIVLTSDGSGTTNWKTLCSVAPGDEPKYVLNPGTASYKLAATITGVSVGYNQ